MKPIVGVFLFASAIAVGATNSQQPLIQSPVGPDEIAFSQIEVGMDSPIKTSGVTVISDQDHWKAFITKLGDDNLKKPKIDWDQYQIVVATLEGSSKDGIALQIQRLHKTKKGVDIEFQLSKDQGGNRYTDDSNSHNTLGKPQFPYAILKTPKIDTKWNIKVLE